MTRKSSREAILDATERVISRDGLAATTMSAVADEAGISKGGLFYHFTGKKELLLSIIDRYLARFHQRRRLIAAALPDSPLRPLKAYVLASLELPEPSPRPLSNLLTLLDDADLREKVRVHHVGLFSELTGSVDRPEWIAMILFATDGLWVADYCGLDTATTELRDRITAALTDLIEYYEKQVVAGQRDNGGPPSAAEPVALLEDQPCGIR
ncbi:MAG: TetR/AcrR family transcriptional regulator [Planctomycetes bacterium]|nr:TetR/AcrR family transcriptional regulator [Planctomycetota bacterium]